LGTTDRRSSFETGEGEQSERVATGSAVSQSLFGNDPPDGDFTLFLTKRETGLQGQFLQQFRQLFLAFRRLLADFRQMLSEPVLPSQRLFRRFGDFADEPKPPAIRGPADR
jgi:hypothetical protein